MIEIIPAIDIIGGKCVRLSQGDYQRCREYEDSPLEMAKMFEDCGARWLHTVDLEGARGDSPKNLKTIEQIASRTTLKIEMGGGIKSDGSLSDAFSAGADRVICGSIACSDKPLFTEWLERYSGEKIVLGADVKGETVAVKGWTESGNITLDDLLAEFLFKGLRHAIITDIENDGMLNGASVSLYRKVSEKFGQLHIIASGGIGCMDDITVLQDNKIESVIVGKAIYEGRISLDELKRFNINRG